MLIKPRLLAVTLAALTLAAVILTACQAPITPTAVKEPQKIDCNLIFPAPSIDP